MRKNPLYLVLFCLTLLFSCAQSGPNDIPPRGTERATDAGARKKAKKKKTADLPETANFYFQNTYENSPFVARLTGRVWYFPLDTPTDWIVEEFHTVREEGTEPYDFDHMLTVEKSDYSADNWFSRELKADMKIVIVWDYIDAQDQNYKYRFQYYEPATPGAEPHYKIWNDAWRARLF